MILVCYLGVSAGHYTAYTQHPRTSEWYHYNDEYVTKQLPQEDDYSSAYILFYKKTGEYFLLLIRDIKFDLNSIENHSKRVVYF